MRQFVAEGKGHIEWNMGFQTFVQASPEDPPIMEVQVKVFSQIKKQFVWRRVSLWSKLGNTKPKKKIALADMGAMVCTVGLDMFWDLGLQKDVMEKSEMVLRRVKRSVLTLGVSTVDISADGYRKVFCLTLN